MIGVTLLGSTGSIGINTLEVLALHPERFKVIALTAQRNVDQLFQQCLKFRPTYAVMLESAAAEQLQIKLRASAPEVQVLAGREALEQVASLTQVDYVMAAIVGAAGLLPTLAAVRAGKRVLLANKEALVMAGEFFMSEVRQYAATLLPVDSEHNALFQCMPTQTQTMESHQTINRLMLTASGGPFRHLALQDLISITPEQACAHPIWAMGKKISIDSATMMNKGFEVIEAHWLFGLPAAQIEVLIHPESIIHSLVGYIDGSVLAQLGNPDMRTPIAHALAWPTRMQAGVKPLDLLSVGQLTFKPVSFERYPCLRLAYEAIAMGGTAPAILNAANEIAVQAFMEHQIDFTDIPGVIEKVLTQVAHHTIRGLEDILQDDKIAREMAAMEVKNKANVASCPA